MQHRHGRSGSVECPLLGNCSGSFALAAECALRLARMSCLGWLEPITGSQERCHGGQPGAASPQGGSEPFAVTDHQAGPRTCSKPQTAQSGHSTLGSGKAADGKQPYTGALTKALGAGQDVRAQIRLNCSVGTLLLGTPFSTYTRP